MRHCKADQHAPSRAPPSLCSQAKVASGFRRENMGQAAGSRAGGTQQKPGVMQPGGTIQGNAALMDPYGYAPCMCTCRNLLSRLRASQNIGFCVPPGRGGHVPAQVCRGIARKVAEGAPHGIVVEVTPVSVDAFHASILSTIPYSAGVR